MPWQEKEMQSAALDLVLNGLRKNKKKGNRQWTENCLTLDSDLALQVFWGRSAQLLMGFHHLFFPGLYYYVHTDGVGGIFF
jgi:hypothetical protein